MPSPYLVFGRQTDPPVFLGAFGVLIDYDGVASSRPRDATDLVDILTVLLHFLLHLFDYSPAIDLIGESGSSSGRYGWSYLLPGQKTFSGMRSIPTTISLKRLVYVPGLYW